MNFFSARVVSSEMAVCVTLVHGNNYMGTGTAEASVFLPKPGYWYLNRVLVQKKDQRGQGVGTYLLTVLKLSLQLRKDFKTLLVEPGGYSNDHPGQVRFYEKNGFVFSEELSGNAYIWTPLSEVK